MNVIKTKIEGLVVLEPTIFKDERGYFFESFNKEKLAEAGINQDFVQDNQSKSCYGVIRGLHYQEAPFAQSKLVRVLHGEILDVCLDIRKDSPTFGQFETVVLSSDNQRQLFVPKGFAHGFSVQSKEAIVLYKTDEFYHPNAERGIAFNDKNLSIPWNIPLPAQIISEKDKNHPSLEELINNLEKTKI